MSIEMTERHLRGFIIMFAEFIRKEKSGKLSKDEAYDKIKRYVEIIEPVIKEDKNG